MPHNVDIAKTVHIGTSCLTKLSETLLDKISLLLLDVSRLFPQLRSLELELVVRLSQLPALLGKGVDPSRVTDLTLGSCCLRISLPCISSIELEEVLFLSDGVL